MLAFGAFDQLYQESVAQVYNHWTPAMQEEIAVHCRGWASDAFDFHTYLQRSTRRYYQAYLSFAVDNEARMICDVGGFWGVFPLTLAKLGYRVTMTETLRYYGESFSSLFTYLTGCGVQIIDYDPFEQTLPVNNCFDVVTIMAVLEHYPHSLKKFMKNAVSLLKPGGLMFIEVPNIAYWPKRMSLLRGQTPLVPVSEIYESEVPFMGHHHEFTIEELRSLAKLSGLSITKEHYYSYSSEGSRLRQVLRHPIFCLATVLMRNVRECLAVTVRKQKAK